VTLADTGLLRISGIVGFRGDVRDGRAVIGPELGEEAVGIRGEIFGIPTALGNILPLAASEPAGTHVESSMAVGLSALSFSDRSPTFKYR